MVEGLALEIVVEGMEADDEMTVGTLLEAEDADDDPEVEDTPLEPSVLDDGTELEDGIVDEMLTVEDEACDGTA